MRNFNQPEDANNPFVQQEITKVLKQVDEARHNFLQAVADRAQIFTWAGEWIVQNKKHLNYLGVSAENIGIACLCYTAGENMGLIELPMREIVKKDSQMDENSEESEVQTIRLFPQLVHNHQIAAWTELIHLFFDNLDKGWDQQNDKSTDLTNHWMAMQASNAKVLKTKQVLEIIMKKKLDLLARYPSITNYNPNQQWN